jgi:hypothetical protein
MRFNVNEIVKVKLNERGHELMRQQHQAFADAFPETFGEFKQKAADADGWSEWQLWDLMHTFGPEIRLGSQPPFETEIEIPVKAPVTP